MILYFIRSGTDWRNGVLVVFSLVFYAWGEPVYIFLMLATVFVNWALTLQIERAYRLRGRSRRRTRDGQFQTGESDAGEAEEEVSMAGALRAKALLICAIAIDLGLLGVFKYAGFIASTIGGIVHVDIPAPDIALPIGISFYTFQVMSYVIDVYRRESVAQRSLLRLLMYVSMFPQLVAGPIVRYEHIAEQIEYRETEWREAGRGVERFLMGLAKKAILANVCGNIADTLLKSENLGHLSFAGAWLGVCMFAFQIYFDFSAYSDMAIGMGRIFGFRYKENFNYPYISRSATEFWRRWHISLSTFFRDYVYIPLGGNRSSAWRNLFVVWALTGLWHGASWNFVLWGLYWFAFIAVERKWLRHRFERWHPLAPNAYCILVFLVGWVFFYFTDIRDAALCLSRMFGFGFFVGESFTDTATALLFQNNAFLFIASILACLPVGRAVARLYRIGEYSLVGVPRTALFAARCVWLAALLYVSTIMLVGNSYNPFIYFRF
ncbi:MAG: MBOAT family protein [Clostridiales Family XIII bacterium]|nr:MBOAT family protein [Clostridiales Family XIII bacterium]